MADEYDYIVRKALEHQLKTAIAASAAPALAIEWPGGLASDGTAFKPGDHQEYLRFSNHVAKPVVWTQGPNPRISGSGFAKIAVRTRPKYGQDRNDILAGYVVAGFPFNLNLDRSGIRTNIDEHPHHRSFDVTDGWGQSTVDIYWNVLRIN